MNTTDLTLISIVVSLICGVGYAYILRAVFNVSELSRLNRIQTRLLIEMAKSAGVPKEAIDEIIKSR